jgi:hypothetical protein
VKRILGALVLAPLLALVPLAASASPLFQPTVVPSASAVHWDACAPIHWSFNPVGAPAGALGITKRAVATIASASGTSWTFDGVTTAVPSESFLHGRQSTDVIIGWTDAAHSSLLATASSKVVAQTQTQWVGDLYTHAVVALNDRTTMPMTGGGSWSTTLLHELGHVMGLSHSDSTHSLMYPIKLKALSGLQPVDIAALQKLGTCDH